MSIEDGWKALDRNTRKRIERKMRKVLFGHEPIEVTESSPEIEFIKRILKSKHEFNILGREWDFGDSVYWNPRHTRAVIVWDEHGPW